MKSTDLVELLEGHKVYLQTHNFPDPDAIASAYGLSQFLKHFGVDSTIVYAGEVEKISTKRMFSEFGITAYNIKDLGEMDASDYIVTVDAQKYNSNITDFPGDEVACVDHHPTAKECEYQYKDVRICGACSSIITSYFIENNIPIDTNTATALLYGIKMDTDSFNRGVTKFDIEQYAALHDLANNQTIVNLYNNTMELEDLHAYGEAIRTIKVYDNIGFASIGFECQDSLIAMVSDFILRLDVVEFAIIYSARNGGYKFSVRSEAKKISAGAITRKALAGIGDGGGHASMAGGMIFKESVPLLGGFVDNEIQKRFIGAIEEMEKNER